MDVDTLNNADLGISIQVLPLELRQMIFKMLPARDLAKCRLICHQWNLEIQEDNMLMRKIWSNITAKKRWIQEAENGNYEFFLAMTEFAADPNPAGEYGCTPLHLTAMYGHLEVFQLLLERCEDKKPTTDNGQTPLHWAARYGHLEVCRHILDRCEEKNPVNER